MSSAVNPKRSVLENKSIIEQEPRKYQEQEKDQGQESTKKVPYQDPSSKNKNQEQRTKNQKQKTIVLRPLKKNQGFRVKEPRFSKKIKIRTPSQKQELKGLSTYNKNKIKNKQQRM